MAITCCKGCIPPKREPGCHDQCNDYKAEKAEHEKLKKSERRRKTESVYCERIEKIGKAYRRGSKKYGVGF